MNEIETAVVTAVLARNNLEDVRKQWSLAEQILHAAMMHLGKLIRDALIEKYKTISVTQNTDDEMSEFMRATYKFDDDTIRYLLEWFYLGYGFKSDNSPDQIS